MPPTPNAARLLHVVAAALSLLVATACSRTPADRSAEAGFARDMATHHAQAADMGFIVRDSSRNESVRTLAADIIITQSAQRGMFMAWLEEWGLPQASLGPRMSWMRGVDHAGPMNSSPPMTGSMPAHDVAPHTDMPLMVGMATDRELDALRAATGADAEVLFLQLMIRHHEGGVLMARALLEQSDREDVVALARHIERSQVGEIATMTTMLRDRGSEPLPSLLQ